MYIDHHSLEAICRAHVSHVHIHVPSMYQPRCRPGHPSPLSAAEPTMALHLDCAIVRPDYVAEVVVKVLPGTTQLLLFASLPYQLAVRAAAEHPT